VDVTEAVCPENKAAFENIIHPEEQLYVAWKSD
jgi:hypothetical protein